MAFIAKDSLSLSSLTVFGIALIIIYVLCSLLYNLFFHPLASYPGPLSHRISIFPRVAYLVKGMLPFHVAHLHAQYGPVVRISPNELSFCDHRAWKDIYGHKQYGQEEFPKLETFYRPISTTPGSLFTASRNEHAVIRRQLSHGFSDRSMKGQEPIIGGYVDVLIQRIREHGGRGTKAVNMRDWINWTTFDIIGDLGFGSSFGCLDNSDYHPWVSMISTSLKITTYVQAMAILLGQSLATRVITSVRWKSREKHRSLVQGKVMQRMELGCERPDLIEGLLRKQDEWQMSIEQISVNASKLILAGSETTATLLTGALVLLATNADKLERVTREVRSSFNKEQDINLFSVAELSYMHACLDECLRMYPPLAVGLPRITPKGGAVVAGTFIPEGVVVGIWQWAINHDPKLWTDPWEFKPERFLGDIRYKNDKLDAMQPFSTGPRNCIGKNLAYAEMRLVLAKLLYSFDMRLAEDSKDWFTKQKNYTLWMKPDLYVHMTPVEH